MTIVRLIKAIKAEVELALENASFERDGDVEVEPLKRPKVYLGYLPNETVPSAPPAGATPLKHVEVDHTPYVIVRAASGEDESYAVDTAKVYIIVGTSSYSEQGYMDVLHIFELLRLAIASKYWIGGMFESVGKVKWMLPEEQPMPIWNGVIESVWSLPGIEKEDILSDY